jgi:hypothetical protein
MASTLRENLPSRPNRIYDREAIQTFDENRREYRENVKMTKSLYGSMAAIVDEDSEQIEGVCKMFIMMTKTGKNAQLLIKYSPKEEGDEYRIKLNKNVDVITAFYIPKDLEWMKFYSGGALIGTFCGEPVEIDLERILAESHTIPEVNDHFIEIILWKSRQGKIGVSHSQEKELVIDGVTYKRVIFVQPMFPITSTVFHEIYILLSDKRDIYLETGITQSDLRAKLLNESMLAWCEDKSDKMPLVRITHGMVGKSFHKQEVKDELDTNKELFDTLPMSAIDLPSDVVNIGDGDIFKA